MLRAPCSSSSKAYSCIGQLFGYRIPCPSLRGTNSLLRFSRCCHLGKHNSKAHKTLEPVLSRSNAFNTSHRSRQQRPLPDLLNPGVKQPQGQRYTPTRSCSRQPRPEVPPQGLRACFPPGPLLKALLPSVAHTAGVKHWLPGRCGQFLDMQARGPVTVRDRPHDGKTSQEFHCSGPRCRGAWRTPLCSRPRETARVLFPNLLCLFPPPGSQPPPPSAPALATSIKPTARTPTTHAPPDKPLQDEPYCCSCPTSDAKE